MLIANNRIVWAIEKEKEKRENKVYICLECLLPSKKSVTFSSIGGSTGTNSEPITMEEIHRIIMSDGFQYFAAAE
jgi:hypothetical protein